MNPAFSAATGDPAHPGAASPIIAFTLLLLAAWSLAAAQLLAQHWALTGVTLLDTDDAMRLTQMRDWLAGRGWYDLHQPRLQPPLGYDSHWSRLIDAGLAGMLFLCGLFVAPELAERLMRSIWPLLWLLPAMSAMGAIAWRIGGKQAALLALVFAAFAVPAYQQFTPGRIDHHNVQIALTLCAVAATVWSDRLRWCSYAAGAFSAAALAIGFEALPYLAVCAGAFGLRYIFERDGGDALRRYALAITLGIVAGFLINVAPVHWARVACDALALNTLLAVALPSLLLLAAGSRDDDRTVIRAAKIAAALGIAFVAFSRPDAPCWRGPYANVDPAVWPVWLSDVREMQPLWRVFRINPLTAIAIAAFPLAAVAASASLWRHNAMRKDFGVLTARAVFLVSAITTVLAIRAFSYATWLGMPLVAAAAMPLLARLRLHAVPARLAAGLLLTPMALSSAGILLADAAGMADRDSFDRPASRACYRTDSYPALAELKPGLIAGDTSFGPYILALTPHAVLAAPYHRLSSGILTAHRGLASPPDEARTILRDAGVDYVVICGPRPPDGLSGNTLAGSLWSRLKNDAVPPWLERVAGFESGPFAVFKLRDRLAAAKAP